MSTPLRVPLSIGRSILIEDAIRQNRFLFILLGIAMVIIGAGAVASPFVITVVAKIFFGWLLLIGGILQIIFAISTRKLSEFFLDLLFGLLFVVAGAWLAFYPLTGVFTLTVFLATVFVLQGIIEVINAFRMHPIAGWGWMLTAGVLALIVGLLILSEFPSSALWAIGALVGINFICTGLAYVLLALTVEKHD
jgi:uncharacterized membrane protein HdeD (DUF308 family)